MRGHTEGRNYENLTGGCLRGADCRGRRSNRTGRGDTARGRGADRGFTDRVAGGRDTERGKEIAPACGNRIRSMKNNIACAL